jgi:tetratricopeptide (TPR) repeat protein
MTTNPPVEKQSQTQSAAPESGFEIAVQEFWQKNRTVVLALVVVGLVAIVGREGWQYIAAQREEGVRADYAKAGDRPEALASFASANSGHELAGIAYLRIADQKYAAGDFRAALENYNKASSSLKVAAVVGRARLGAAISQLNGGDKSAGEAALKAIAADTTLLKPARAEASYHLAAVAYEAGNQAEVGRLVGEINKLDTAGIWTDRAAALQVLK